MPRLPNDEFVGLFHLQYTDNTTWLEEVDMRRVLGPEEILSALEDQLEAGEITEAQLTAHYMR